MQHCRIIVDVKPLSFSICKISTLSGRSRSQSVCQFSFSLTHFCNSHAAITMRFAAARAHSFNTSPLLLVTTSLSHHPSSPPFVITLRHHFPQSPPSVAFFYVMYRMYFYFVITLRTLRHHFPQAPPFIGDVIRREVCRVGFDQRNPKPETRNRNRLLKLVSNCETRNPKLTLKTDLPQDRSKPENRNPKPTLKT